MYFFIETCFSARWISLMFGIQYLTMVYRAGFDFVSNVTQSRSVVYVEVCALSSHIFFICFEFLDICLAEPAKIASGIPLCIIINYLHDNYVFHVCFRNRSVHVC